MCVPFILSKEIKEETGNIFEYTGGIKRITEDLVRVSNVPVLSELCPHHHHVH